MRLYSRPYPIIFFVSVLVVVVTIAYLLFSFDDQHVIEYRTLMENTDNAKKSNDHSYTSTQNHKGALKEVWFNAKNQRLHMRLISEAAELILDYREGHTEVIERMKNVTCIMQEELYYLLADGRKAILSENGTIVLKDSPTVEIPVTDAMKPVQVFRYMKADKAVYYYQTDRMIGENVTIQRFIAPGHQLIDVISNLKPVMSGVATTVEFALSSSDFNFVAHDLKATLDTSKGQK